ncbi:D-arabinono-1,4-lactone oxidase, partial [Dietzia sp.]|uniref:D-arabinono-1,4-lactone oxidase n=1 Tax=Dietzia sp. TaxID=1871616 RepID=UPI002FDAA86E
EDIFREAGGRPHWGKMHSLGPDELSALYPRYGDFVAARDAADPGRVFRNVYTDQVLPR